METVKDLICNVMMATTTMVMDAQEIAELSKDMLAQEVHRSAQMHATHIGQTECTCRQWVKSANQQV